MAREIVKEKLLKAALLTFSEFGYSATTTRMIASEAGVNIAAISYYFDGKEGLYQALIQSMVEKFKQQITGMQMQVKNELGYADQKAAKALLLSFLAQLAQASMGDEIRQFALIMIREQNNPSQAFGYLYENFSGNVLSTIKHCLEKIMPGKSDIYYVLTTQSLMAQALLFLAFKGNLKHLLKTNEFTPEHFETHYKLLENTIEKLG
ncbi:CerR family C-terminal domain-containing protein [Facilibium subflavum]|uniref:CerR family C-terminal domain-containing protein n=1 Tax=Facilibium subflavum TaxID=2219058 RepID=UPI000E6493C9|nr:CerR family C-terminal domain-containing protein [Facilibium subflavum]